MSSQVTGVGVSSEGEFGANEWLVDELYEQFKVDKNSVDKAWWPILEAYQPVDTTATPPSEAPARRPPRRAPPAAEPRPLPPQHLPPRRRRTAPRQPPPQCAQVEGAQPPMRIP